MTRGQAGGEGVLSRAWKQRRVQGQERRRGGYGLPETGTLKGWEDVPSH